jgi:hypothetical protein
VGLRPGRPQSWITHSGEARSVASSQTGNLPGHCFGGPALHPFAKRRAELVAELHRVGRPLDGPGLTPERKADVIAAYEQALRQVFALDEEAEVE